MILAKNSGKDNFSAKKIAKRINYQILPKEVPKSPPTPKKVFNRFFGVISQVSVSSLEWVLECNLST
jgi:hypothetical protein